MSGAIVPVDLPYDTTLKGGIRARFERPSQRTVDAGLDILRTAVSRGDGVSSEDVPTREDFLDPPPRMATCVVINLEDDSIIAVIIRIHSPLCRSSSPVYCAGPTVANPRYRGKGIGFDVMKQLKYINLGRKSYRGYLGRATLTSPTRLRYKFTGGQNIGLIPSCTYLTGKGIIDDVIGYHDPGRNTFKSSWRKEVSSGQIVIYLGISKDNGNIINAQSSYIRDVISIKNFFWEHLVMSWDDSPWISDHI